MSFAPAQQQHFCSHRRTNSAVAPRKAFHYNSAAVPLPHPQQQPKQQQRSYSSSSPSVPQHHSPKCSAVGCRAAASPHGMQPNAVLQHEQHQRVGQGADQQQEQHWQQQQQQQQQHKGDQHNQQQQHHHTHHQQQPDDLQVGLLFTLVSGDDADDAEQLEQEQEEEQLWSGLQQELQQQQQQQAEAEQLASQQDPLPQQWTQTQAAGLDYADAQHYVPPIQQQQQQHVEQLPTASDDTQAPVLINPQQQQTAHVRQQTQNPGQTSHEQAVQQLLQQYTHWRQLLPLSANIQSLSQLVAVLAAAQQLQPTTAASTPAAGVAAAGSVGFLSTDSHRFEQQQYLSFLSHLISTAAAVLVKQAPPAATKRQPGNQPAAAAAAASSAAAAAFKAPRAGDILSLLAALVSLGSSLLQQLHPQLKQLPLADAIKVQRLKRMKPHQVLRIAVHLALLKPHVQDMPLELQQRMCEAALSRGPVGSSSSGSSKSRSKQQQHKQQHLPSCSAAALTLWAAARLGWQPWQQHVQRAVCAVLQQLPGCSSSDLAMAVWAMAELRVSPGRLQRLLTITQHDEQQQQQELLPPPQKQQQLGRQLTPPRHQRPQRQQEHVAAQHGRPPPQVSAVLAAALQQHCPSFSPPELVAVVGAAAQLQVLPDSGLMRSLLQTLSHPQVLLQLSDEDMCSVLWSLARMHQKRAAVPVKRLKKQQRDGKKQRQEQGDEQQGHATDHVSPHHVADELDWQQQESDSPLSSSSSSSQELQELQQQQHKRQQRAVAHAQMLQQPALVPVDLVWPLLQAYSATLATCSSRNIARTLWSVSALRVQPPTAWVVGVLEALATPAQNLSSLDSTSCMLVALALRRLRYLPDGAWLEQFWLASLAFFPQQQQQQQDFAVGSASSSSSSGQQQRPAFTQPELTVLVSSAYELSRLSRPQSKGAWRGQKPPGVWLDAAAQATAGYLSPQLDLATLLMFGDAMLRFSSMAGEPWPGPGAAWWQGFEAATEPYLQAADPQELVQLLKVLSKQQQHRGVGQSWVAAFLQASGAVLAGGGGGQQQQNQQQQVFSASNLVALGKGLAALGVLPDRAWLQAWELAVDLAGAGMSGTADISLQNTRAQFARLAAAADGQSSGRRRH